MAKNDAAKLSDLGCCKQSAKTDTYIEIQILFKTPTVNSLAIQSDDLSTIVKTEDIQVPSPPSSENIFTQSHLALPLRLPFSPQP